MDRVVQQSLKNHQFYCEEDFNRIGDYIKYLYIMAKDHINDYPELKYEIKLRIHCDIVSPDTFYAMSTYLTLEEQIYLASLVLEDKEYKLNTINFILMFARYNVSIHHVKNQASGLLKEIFRRGFITTDEYIESQIDRGASSTVHLYLGVFTPSPQEVKRLLDKYGYKGKNNHTLIDIRKYLDKMILSQI